MNKLVRYFVCLILAVGLMLSLGATAFAETYTDALCNVSYSIPYGWVQQELNAERDYLNAKFVKGESMIMAGSGDIWGQMSSSERAGYTRDTFTLSSISDDDIDSLLGISDSVEDLNVYKAKYGNFDYIMAEYPYSITVMSYVVEADVTMAFTIINGYGVFFQLMETGGENCMADFEKVLISVVNNNAVKAEASSAESKPAVKDEATSAESKPAVKDEASSAESKPAVKDEASSAESKPAVSSGTSSAAPAAKSNGSAMSVLWPYLLIAAVITVTVILCVRLKKKAGKTPDNPVNYPAASQDRSMGITEGQMFCRYCSRVIKADSHFCKYCGGKLV